MSQDSARQDLVKELKEWAYASNNTMISIYKVADFILERDKKIVAPLVKVFEKIDNDENIDEFEQHELISSAIDETLKLAQIE